ncbi:MAG: Copper-sensing transcriptional repressor CsoR (Copper-sensitive operonrepressor) [Candidatus Gottesmanbacteria bacterium GW2011_GWA1_48_13]|uniref:Copper-sensing transcriptional repressor CsoR (Copper-sensitive operonrepressor) n=3 Tax=Candidatus Gottesmaniibacteriota TaxID=1752720 RepID=A0A0G1UNF2_9BACT|nr:MAG: Copper-sensing transcriptional repressor CsoR (Copper-sensitive operonrepressor) [Candidatus Gottesmanbacteria bacterium GW2011_GWA1_48_13]
MSCIVRKHTGVDKPEEFLYDIYIPYRGIEYMPKGIPRDQSIQHTILHRMKIARGHLDRVVNMVESGHYCIDVIHQSLAVQSALKSIDQLVLKNHMETCVADAIKQGRKNEVIEEVMKVMEKR